jgi:DNA-binding NarL/FixJ family response regulator
MNVLIVDDHPVARRGLTVTVQDGLPVERLWEADTAGDAIASAQEHRPDLVLLDMRMPGEMSAAEVCRDILAAAPAARVVIVTAFDHTRTIRDCLEAGASGCLLKDSSELDLASSLRQIMSGDMVLDPRIAQRLARELIGDRTGDSELSRREREVLLLLSEGCSNKTIARKLDLSEATVKGYVTTLLRKLGASSRLEAVVIAARRGLFDADHP